MQCEGYARYPVILQYTSSGLKRRERYEEAKLSSDSALVPNPPGRQARSFSASPLDLSKQPAVTRFIVNQVGVTCLDSYFPGVGGAGAAPEIRGNWMWMTLDMSDQGRALATSFAALCLGRVGGRNDDETLMARSRQQYSASLNALQRALQKPELAFQDRTLAAIRVLSIYEVRVVRALIGRVAIAK